MSTEDAMVDLTGRSLKYQIGKGDDVSFVGRKRRRFTVLMAGTEGASPEAIATALQRIAKKRLSGQRSPKAVIIFAYRPGDDTANAYTVGRVIATKDGLAWNGEPVRDRPYFEIDLVKEDRSMPPKGKLQEEQRGLPSFAFVANGTQKALEEAGMARVNAGIAGFAKAAAAAYDFGEGMAEVNKIVDSEDDENE